MKQLTALILLLCILLSACSAEAPVQEVPELAEPVQAQPKTAQVQRADIIDVSTLLGTICVETIPVSFPIDGTLEEIHVLPGQAVRKGDLLATLNTQSLQDQLQQQLEQQADTEYSNALSNQNLELSIRISKLRLDALLQQQQAALAEQQALMTQLQTDLEHLQQANAQTVAQLEQELQQLQAQLNPAPASEETQPDPSTPPAGDQALLEEIARLQAQLEQTLLANAEAEAQAAALVQQQQTHIDTLTAQQASQAELSRLDIRDAELVLTHAKQTQALAAQRTNTKITQLRLQLEKTAITAPADGTVIWITESSRATAEKAVIYIANPNRQFVRTDEFSQFKLESAQRIYALVGSTEFDLTYRPTPVDEKIANSLSGLTPSSLFDFSEDVSIPVGQNAMVYCVHNSRENVLSIPAGALNRDSQGYYVYRINEGQREQVYISIGMVSPLRVEIVSGLEEGDVLYVAD